MNLLIINQDAEYLKQALEFKFSELSIHAASTEDQAREHIETADILIAIRISDTLIRKAGRLQWIQSLISGVHFLLDIPSLGKETLITSTSGIHGPQMSETAFLLMLALNRNLLLNIKNQANRTWDRWPTKLLFQKKVGILGVGMIGKEIARKCKAFGMTVYGITSVKRAIDCVDYPHGPDELTHVMREVDYFISVLPSTPQTRNMIGAKELSVMKPTAFFINIGRGDTVDEDALAHALETGKIAGAGLDVFCHEPLHKESPLWAMKNVIITPHIGGVSDIYLDQALPIIEENLCRFIKGERRDLINLIDR
ncbi:D-2-hydroxyacid dehydrogenase [Thermodesulfobacteriota bacterium]